MKVVASIAVKLSLSKSLSLSAVMLSLGLAYMHMPLEERAGHFAIKSIEVDRRSSVLALVNVEGLRDLRSVASVPLSLVSEWLGN